MYAGEANLTSLFFMNLYRIYVYLVCFYSPLCWWIDKTKRRIERVYICKFNICCLCIYICFVLCTSLQYLFVYCYACVKGELLWSLTLIHAYITPWVLSSSKLEWWAFVPTISPFFMMIKLMELYIHGLKISLIEAPP